jgi:hypothetical protein
MKLSENTKDNLYFDLIIAGLIFFIYLTTLTA